MMITSFVTRKWPAIVILLVLLSSAGVTLAAPTLVNSLSSGVGYDPLSRSEQDRALNSALSALGTSGSLTSNRSEVLLVERHQETKDVYRQGVWPRRADVYIYYYDTDTLEHLVVNNQTNTIDEREALQGVQLPPTETEIQTAVNYVFSDAQLLAEMGVWFKKLTGQDLTAFDQVAAKAFIFHADSMGTANVGEAAPCGVNRCVQLLIYTKDMIAFEKSPVVNLSTEQLATVLHPQ